MTAFAALLLKEFRHMLRNRGTWFGAVAIPLVQMVILGFIDTDVRHVPMAVVDGARTAESRSFLAGLVNSGTFRFIGLAASRDELRRCIVAGRAAVGIEIPPDFSRRLLGGHEAPVRVLIDGSDANVSAQASAATSGLALEESRRLEAAHRRGRTAEIQTAPVILFNPDSRARSFLLPALVALLPMFSASLLAAFSIVRERERGTLERIMVTPARPIIIISGKLVPYVGLGGMQLALGLVIMTGVFRVPINGSLLLLCALSAVYLMALLSIGLFVSAVARTQAEAVQIAQLLSLPSILLSGYIFPVYTLQPVLQWLGKLFPATHFINICRAVIIRGAGVADLWASVGALVLISVVVVAGSTRVFRRTLG